MEGVSSSEAETSRQRSGGGGGGTTAGSGTKHTAAQATRGRSRCCDTASRSSPAASRGLRVSRRTDWDRDWQPAPQSVVFKHLELAVLTSYCRSDTCSAMSAASAVLLNLASPLQSTPLKGQVHS